QIDLEECIQKFVRMGYVRSDMVSSPGEFSVRGGIIDIYPLTEDYPIRIELFDDVIDSIRSFSLEDQRSINKRNDVIIGPASEIILEEEHFVRLIESLEDRLGKSLK